jgi:hypothetical protein
MKIRELLTDESKWTQGAFAETETGHPVDYDDESAAKFCIVGAVRKCYGRGDEATTVFRKVKDEVQRVHGGLERLAAWNDDDRRTFAEVKALVERLDI